MKKQEIEHKALIDKEDFEQEGYKDSVSIATFHDALMAMKALILQSNPEWEHVDMLIPIKSMEVLILRHETNEEVLRREASEKKFPKLGRERAIALLESKLKKLKDEQ